MLEVLGQLAPVALGVALSPVPVTIVVLVLMGPMAVPSGTRFLLGWVLGVAIAVSVFAVLGGAVADAAGDGPRPVLGTVKLLLGAGLLALAVKQWRGRPAPGQAQSLPAWMAGAGTMAPGRAFVVAFGLAALNPVNMLLAAAGGALIAAAAGTGTAVIAVVAFTIIASGSVAAPVTAYLLSPGTSAQRLEAAREWLTANNSTVTTVMLLALGTVVAGQGLAAF